MKIFIVDDDLMMAEALSDHITSRMDAEVHIFYTGEECLQHLHENPDVIILDYYLNTVNKDAENGMEILKQIKKTQPDTHIIMLSGQEHYGVALKTVQQGAEEYVMKNEQAFDKISRLVESYK